MIVNCLGFMYTRPMDLHLKAVSRKVQLELGISERVIGTVCFSTFVAGCELLIPLPWKCTWELQG